MSADSNPIVPAPAPGAQPAETNSISVGRMDRRDAIKWMLAAAATAGPLEMTGFATTPAAAKPASGSGYGTDPDLLKTYKPGELWPLTLTPAQRATVVALCDTIIPADARGPAASTVGVPDFIDEWISAPYPAHQADRPIVLDGLAWVEEESRKRFGNTFANLIVRQRNAICDDICHEKPKPELRKAAQFFRRFRDLTAGAYYTTPEGMKDIGYTGNVPLQTFDGPPAEVLKKLGLA